MYQFSLYSALVMIAVLLKASASVNYTAVEFNSNTRPSLRAQNHSPILSKSYQDKLQVLKVKYKLMATHGDVDAQLRTGVLYEKSAHDANNYVLARYWYSKAALQDEPAAQNNLGRLYYLGLGGPCNDGLAQFWYEKAAAARTCKRAI